MDKNNALLLGQRIKHILQPYYGTKLDGLLLYGSTARNEAFSDSDVDFLVLLQPPFDYFEELHKIIELTYPEQLEADNHISIRPVETDAFKAGTIRLYQNVLKEGVPV
ncbi:MAG TPA: nucleotidyltransferase domain-containing protein [Candidatus Hydrogenedentes bacterium]|nr:nucleotidyltransferase domain-containing protein [Candidatus Hydrogenedentota bacterium]